MEYAIFVLVVVIAICSVVLLAGLTFLVADYYKWITWSDPMTHATVVSTVTTICYVALVAALGCCVIFALFALWICVLLLSISL